MKFTVCTATFNRAHTLERVFSSLLAQTVQDFEWLVIDDGSTDNTDKLIQEWALSAPFPIRYEFQENQGKHVAINRGARLANGEFFLIADSDDMFFGNALQIFLEAWNGIPKTQRSQFTGVTGLCMTAEDHVVGDVFPSDIFDSNSAQLFYRYGIKGEKWGFHRTDVIRQFPFPELSGIPFFRESIIWFSIAKLYRTRFINQPVRIYQQNASDQLTKLPIERRAFENIFYAMSLNNDAEFIFIAPWQFCKMALQGARLSWHKSEPISQQLSRLEKPRVKALWIAAFLPSLILYYSDVLQARISR